MSVTGLIDVIHWLEDVFEHLELRRSYGGAIAYNYYAPPRFTQEVDALARNQEGRQLRQSGSRKENSPHYVGDPA